MGEKLTYSAILNRVRADKELSTARARLRHLVGIEPMAPVADYARPPALASTTPPDWRMVQLHIANITPGWRRWRR